MTVNSAFCDASDWRESSLSLFSWRHLLQRHTCSSNIAEKHDVYLQIDRAYHQCFHFIKGLYRPPQAVLYNKLQLNTRGQKWKERMTITGKTIALYQYECTMYWDAYGGFAGIICYICYACDITTASVMAWLRSAALLVWMISLCVNICESKAHTLLSFLREQTVCRASVCLLLQTPFSQSPCFDWCLGSCYSDWLLWKG